MTLTTLYLRLSSMVNSTHQHILSWWLWFMGVPSVTFSQSQRNNFVARFWWLIVIHNEVMILLSFCNIYILRFCNIYCLNPYINILIFKIIHSIAGTPISKPNLWQCDRRRNSGWFYPRSGAKDSLSTSYAIPSQTCGGWRIWCHEGWWNMEWHAGGSYQWGMMPT